MTINDLEEDTGNFGVKKGIPINGASVQRKKGLNDCPLCGNEAIYIRYKNGYFVKCTCCECMVALQISVITETIIPFETMEDAAKAWNKREGSTKSANIINARTQPDLILQRRAWRAERIAESIKKGCGDFVKISQIVEDTKIPRSTVMNMMKFVRKDYPEVKSQSGKSGYYWED